MEITASIIMLPNQCRFLAVLILGNRKIGTNGIPKIIRIAFGTYPMRRGDFRSSAMSVNPAFEAF
jgi:hypothetical protein